MNIAWKIADFLANALARESLTILIFGQIGSTAKDAASLLHRFIELHLLESMERVVVDEYRNRTLSWQIVFCMLYGVSNRIQTSVSRRLW